MKRVMMLGVLVSVGAMVGMVGEWDGDDAPWRAGSLSVEPAIYADRDTQEEFLLPVEPVDSLYGEGLEYEAQMSSAEPPAVSGMVMQEEQGGEEAVESVGGKRRRVEVKRSRTGTRDNKRRREELDAIGDDEKRKIAERWDLGIDIVGNALSWYKARDKTRDSFIGASGEDLKVAAKAYREHLSKATLRTKATAAGLNAISDAEKKRIAQKYGLELETVKKALSRYRARHKTAQQFRDATEKDLKAAARDYTDHVSKEGLERRENVAGLRRIGEEEIKVIADRLNLTPETVDQALDKYKQLGYKTVQQFRDATAEDLKAAARDYADHERKKASKAAGLNAISDAEKKKIAQKHGLELETVRKALIWYRLGRKTAQQFLEASGEELEAAAIDYTDHVSREAERMREKRRLRRT